MIFKKFQKNDKSGGALLPQLPGLQGKLLNLRLLFFAQVHWSKVTLLVIWIIHLLILLLREEELFDFTPSASAIAFFFATLTTSLTWRFFLDTSLSFSSCHNNKKVGIWIVEIWHLLVAAIGFGAVAMNTGFRIQDPVVIALQLGTAYAIGVVTMWEGFGTLSNPEEEEQVSPPGMGSQTRGVKWENEITLKTLLAKASVVPRLIQWESCCVLAFSGWWVRSGSATLITTILIDVSFLLTSFMFLTELLNLSGGPFGRRGYLRFQLILSGIAALCFATFSILSGSDSSAAEGSYTWVFELQAALSYGVGHCLAFEEIEVTRVIYCSSGGVANEEVQKNSKKAGRKPCQRMENLQGRSRKPFLQQITKFDRVGYLFPGIHHHPPQKAFFP